MYSFIRNGHPRSKEIRRDDWMKNAYWDHFVETGKVEDYLCYKGMEICQQTMELYKTEKKGFRMGRRTDK